MSFVHSLTLSARLFVHACQDSFRGFRAAWRDTIREFGKHTFPDHVADACLVILCEEIARNLPTFGSTIGAIAILALTKGGKG